MVKNTKDMKIRVSVQMFYQANQLIEILKGDMMAAPGFSLGKQLKKPESERMGQWEGSWQGSLTLSK